MTEESSDDDAEVGDGTPPVETTDDEEWRSVADREASDDREWDDPPGVDLSPDDPEDDQSAVGGNVFGSATSDTDTLEPGTLNPENVAFVLLGVVLAAFVFYQFFLLVG
jgi:hypothetical protein